MTYTHTHREAVDRKVERFLSLVDFVSTDKIVDSFQRVFIRYDVLFMVDYWCDSHRGQIGTWRHGWVRGGPLKYALTWVIDKCNILAKNHTQCVSWFVVPENIVFEKTDFMSVVDDERGGRWKEAVDCLMKHYGLKDDTVTPRFALRKAIAARSYLNRAYAELSDVALTSALGGWEHCDAIINQANSLEMPHMAYDLSVDVLDRIISGGSEV